MKAAEVHNLKDDELVAKLVDAKQEAFNLRFRHATGELENTARLGQAGAQLALVHLAEFRRPVGHQTSSERTMILALIGSFWMARLSAPFAISSLG